MSLSHTHTLSLSVSVLLLCSQALRLQWREAEKHQADLQTRLSEAQQSLADTQASLTQTGADLSSSRALVEELQASRAKEIQRLEEELSQAQSDRDNAAREFPAVLYPLPSLRIARGYF